MFHLKYYFSELLYLGENNKWHEIDNWQRMLLDFSNLHKQLQRKLFKRRKGRKSHRIYQQGRLLGFMGRQAEHDTDRNEYQR